MSDPAASGLPVRVSVVIPTFDRPLSLSSCLEAMGRQTYPRNLFEVIVVDDGGRAPLDALIQSYEGTLRITLLRQLNRGPASARNLGASAASGGLIAFTDDDCVPAADWLARLMERHAEAPLSALGGETRNALDGNPYSTASQMLVTYLIDYTRAPQRIQFLPSSNLAFPAETFRSIGGFSARFPRAAAEDRELCDRWQRHGHPVAHVPEAVVHHAHCLSGITFLRQHFLYGRGAFHYHRSRSEARQEPMKLEPVSFYLNLLAYPFKRASLTRGAHLALLLIASQAANAAGFFRERLT